MLCLPHARAFRSPALQVLVDNLLPSTLDVAALPPAVARVCLPHWLEAAGWVVGLLSDAAAAALGRLPATQRQGLPRSRIDHVSGYLFHTRMVRIKGSGCFHERPITCRSLPRFPKLCVVGAWSRLQPYQGPASSRSDAAGHDGGLAGQHAAQVHRPLRRPRAAHRCR